MDAVKSELGIGWGRLRSYQDDGVVAVGLRKDFLGALDAVESALDRNRDLLQEFHEHLYQPVNVFPLQSTTPVSLTI